MAFCKVVGGDTNHGEKVFGGDTHHGGEIGNFT
jgi:hypothetical protein